MNIKKIYLMLITIAFLVCVVFSCAYIFVINKVDVNFEVLEGYEVEEIQTSLEEFKGKNLLFLSSSEIEEVLAKYTAYKIVSIEKKYPDELTVSIKERKETFAVVSGDKTYLLDEEGFVIKSVEEYNANREIVSLNFNGLEILSSNSGHVIKTNDDELLFSVFLMAKKINYYNCISSIEIQKAPEKRVALFKTYTGVIIEVPDAHVRGGEKIDYAFNEYDKCDDDFIKSFKKITVYVDAISGEIKATWTEGV